MTSKWGRVVQREVGRGGELVLFAKDKGFVIFSPRFEDCSLVRYL